LARLVVCFAVIAGLGLVLPGCGSDADDEEGPGAVVEVFYKHLNDENFSEAMALYSADALSALEGGDPAETGFADWARQETREGSLQRIAVLGVEQPGETATVHFEIVYGDGTKARRSVTLVREDGTWRMNLVS
jgi:hypothetical protein